jgi:hypothetical protein
VTDVLDLRSADAELVAQGVVAAQAQVIDAIERELAGQGPSYAEHVLKLSEAYSWLAGQRFH